ncbi:UdgX family uracil-DNA binding protein [Salipiger mucosus]|uniref:Type-4 uracil-DNA glycosylase n=1 Tax=Salipiger mucosus DSM 16094 TaxID=1123237 RepID=S9R1M6_9RHOB|nr:UdgX family uracil-DNA binding protein [Salipiger mucosus]EPX85797.1 Domain protein often clustered or fused with uracil-DNA glycosylase / Uracil-DNA glycosylase [Salipiger mucosus DSM 16094]
MRRITLPETGTFEAWRDAARSLLAADVPPEAVLWQRGAAEEDLFAEDALPPAGGGQVTVPRGFVDLARRVVWHRDPERFGLLYALLWALRRERGLLSDRGDPRVARLQGMAKAVGRDRHKMTAFVRFREIGEPEAPRRAFAAWFEPAHFIMEPVAPFFTDRFGDMDWTIATPDLTAVFEGGRLRFEAGQPRPPLPEDATEELWRTYFRSIFNPARLKVSAMTAEMPRKYWHNMPEAALIPGLIAGAGARAAEMAEALAGCRRCPLWRDATQAVPGEGPQDAKLMVVGEQPGDREDLAGRPFVGPAGQLFDRVAAEAGLDRGAAYVTNAVKHFKFRARGKRRLHRAPERDEIEHCRWWLDLERAGVRPRLILAMGATALASLTGSGAGLLRRRGGVEETEDGTPVLVTVHPSYLLRLPEDARAAEVARFRADLSRAAEITGCTL